MGKEEQKNSENSVDQFIENKRHDRSKKEGVGEILDGTRQNQNKFVQNLAKKISWRRKFSKDKRSTKGMIIFLAK